jgi:hypothetical protein
MERNPQAWFAREVIAGIGQLRSLGLSFSPSDEAAVTAQVWISALWMAGPVWHEGMSQRIQDTFGQLVSGFRSVDEPEAKRQWPQPPDFLAAFDYLGRRQTPDFTRLALPAPTQAQMAQNAARKRDAGKTGVREALEELARRARIQGHLKAGREIFQELKQGRAE